MIAQVVLMRRLVAVDQVLVESLAIIRAGGYGLSQVRPSMNVTVCVSVGQSVQTEWYSLEGSTESASSRLPMVEAGE